MRDCSNCHAYDGWTDWEDVPPMCDMCMLEDNEPWKYEEDNEPWESDLVSIYYVENSVRVYIAENVSMQYANELLLKFPFYQIEKAGEVFK